MKHLFRLFLVIAGISGLIFLFIQQPTTSRAGDVWHRVSDIGFGESRTGSIKLKSFNGKLIAGTSGGNPSGTALYSYDGNPNNLWTKIRDGGLMSGTPNPTSAITDFEVFNSKLYALVSQGCTINNGNPAPGNCQWAWSSSDAQNWATVGMPNFLGPSHAQINTANKLAVLGTSLFANESTFDNNDARARVFVNSGNESWTKAYPSGGYNEGVGSNYTTGGDMISYNGNLFMQTGPSLFLNSNWTRPATIYKRSDSGQWTVSKDFGQNSAFGATYGCGSIGSDSFTIFNNQLYSSVITKLDSSRYESAIWRAIDPAATSWEKTYTFTGSLNAGYPDGKRISKLLVFNNKLFYSTMSGCATPTGTGGQIWSSADGRVFTQNNTDGFGSSANYSITDMEVFNNAIYAGVRNLTGSSVWRLEHDTGQDFGTISIQLPPKLVMTPDKLFFPNSSATYTFNNSTKQFEITNPPFPSHSVVTTTLGSGDGQYYVITISHFPANEPPSPKDFRLTFQDNVPGANIDQLALFLKNGQTPTASLTGPGCEVGGVTHICLKTITNASAPGQTLPEAVLFQAVPLKGIFVSGNGVGGGNVAAGRNISGFTLDSHSIAVGGNNIDVDGGTQLPHYIVQRVTIFSWGSVSGLVSKMFNLGKTLMGTRGIGRSGHFNGTHYTSNTWVLNSVSPDPAVNLVTSFSNPPEGSIWYTDSQLFLDAPTTNLSGAGTIVVNGNLEINGPISCEPSGKTRLAFLVNGDIRINTNSIACGAYIAMGGKLTFSNQTNGNMKGIFIARDSVLLPNPNQLTGPYIIKYDSYLAAHPTVLTQELLNAILSSAI
jgi:hypothetical protein